MLECIAVIYSGGIEIFEKGTVERVERDALLLHCHRDASLLGHLPDGLPLCHDDPSLNGLSLLK